MSVKNDQVFDDQDFLNQELQLETTEAADENSSDQKNFDDQLWNSEFQELPENSKVDLADDTVHSFRTINRDTKKQLNTTTIRWNGKDYPVVIRETVRYLAKHLINHNFVNGYSLVTFIGKSGSGKSTFTQTLAHYVHKIATELFKTKYAIEWFRKKEIEGLDKIIASLEKGINRLIIFEDASFVFNDVKESDIEEVMGKLTYIRHTLQAKVIVLVQIHYSKALEKFLRDGDLKILTSISDEEKDNFYRLFGSSSKFMIELFARKFHSMNVEGYYYSNAGTTKVYKYYTKQPFKLALVSDFGKLHFCNYHQASCEYCQPRFDQNKFAKVSESKTLKDFCKELLDGYHERDVLLNARFYFYANAGIDNLKPAHKSIMHKLVAYFHDHPEDYKTMVFEMTENGKTLESIFRDFGLIERNVTREEKRKMKKAERRKAKQIKLALEQQKKDKASGVITEATGEEDKSEAEDLSDSVVQTTLDNKTDAHLEPIKEAMKEQAEQSGVKVSDRDVDQYLKELNQNEPEIMKILSKSIQNNLPEAEPVQEPEPVKTVPQKPAVKFEDTEEGKRLLASLADATKEADEARKAGKPADRSGLGFDPLDQNNSGQIDENEYTSGDLATDIKDINPNITVKKSKSKGKEKKPSTEELVESNLDSESIVSDNDFEF